MPLFEKLRAFPWSRLLIGLAILLAVAVAGAVLFRKPLLEQGIAWLLRDLEIPLASLNVERLDHRSLVLRDVALGPGRLLSADSVEVSFRLPELLSLKVRSARVDGPLVSLDLIDSPDQLDETVALIERLRTRFAGGEDTGPPPPLPPVDLSGGRVALASADGSASLAFAAAAQPRDPGGFVVTADLSSGRFAGAGVSLDEIQGPLKLTVDEDGSISFGSDIGIAAVSADAGGRLPGALRAKVDASLDADRSVITVSAGLAAPEAGAALSVASELTNFPSAPEGSLDLSATLDLARGALVPVGAPAETTGSIAAQFDGRFAAGARPRLTLSGGGNIAADDVRIPGIGLANADSLTFQVQAQEDAISLGFAPEDAVLSIRPAEALRAGLPPAIAALFDGTITLDLSETAFEATRNAPDNDGPVWQALAKPRVTLGLPGGAGATLSANAYLRADDILAGAQGTGDAVLSFEGLTIETAGLALQNARGAAALDYSGTADAFDLRLSQPATLSADVLSAPGVQSRSLPEITLTAGTLRAERPASEKPRFSGALEVAAETPFEAMVGAEPESARPLSVGVGTVRLSGAGVPGDCSSGSAEIDETKIGLADNGAALSNIRIALSHDCQAGGLLASATVGSARQLGDKPILQPVSLRADVTDTDGRYMFDASVALMDGTELLVAAGHAAPDGTEGEIVLSRTAPLVFAPGGTNPKDISPALALLSGARGRIDGRARYAWSGDGTDSTADVEISGLGFRQGAVTVTGMDLALKLDPVWPPTTKDSQVLSVQRVDAGTALEDIQMAYDILPTEPLQLRVNDLSFKVLDGTLRLSPFTVDPARLKTRTEIQIADVDMAALAALSKLKGFEANGRLNGRIPVLLDGRTFAIKGGRLDAAGPGTLHYRSAKAAEVLRSQGVEGEMLLKALEDFHYESLGMDLDKTESDDLSLKLSVLGNNPDVLDGQPFQINLNLTSQITPVINALAEAYRVYQETMRRIWTTK